MATLLVADRLASMLLRRLELTLCVAWKLRCGGMVMTLLAGTTPRSG